MQELDRQIFFWINHDWSNPFFDAFFPWITHLRNSAPMVVVLVIWLLTKGGKKGRVCVLTLILAIAVSDRVIDSTLKPGIDRTRPCIALEESTLRVKRRKSPSCPSAHAANIFAAMVILGLFYRKSLWAGLPIATAVALSRVYVGVHYPFDITFGASFGSGVGAGSVGVVRVLGSRYAWLDAESSGADEECEEGRERPS